MIQKNKTCKNCGAELIVKTTQRTPEQLKKSYYYTAYYYCTNCHKLYHDDKFKIQNQLLASGGLFAKVSKSPTPSPRKEYDVHIWTDGACTNNGYANSRAAWAFVSGKTEKAGIVVGKQTNNTAEAYAIYHALLWAAEEKKKRIKIYSDSQITLGNLAKSPEKIKENRGIFELISDLIAANNLIVDYEKVLGHSDNVNNNRADKLANTLAGIK